MDDHKKISNLTMKAVLVLLPTFVVPALIAVVVIKKLNLNGVQALLPLGGALIVSWLIVARVIVWARRAFNTQDRN